MIIKRKLFGEKAIVPGFVGGLGAGAYLGKHAVRKIGQAKTYLKYDPEKEAEELDKEAEKSEKLADKLKSDKEYMKRYKSAKDKYNKKMTKIEGFLANGDESLWDDEFFRATSEKDKEIPEGDIEEMGFEARQLRNKAKELRSNPKAAKKKAAKEFRDDELERKGAIVGSALGAVGGGFLGSRI